MRPVTDLKRKVAPFHVVTDMTPAGDQPAAIDEIERRIRAGEQDTVLLGATGTGKTVTVAWLAERLDRPTLVMLPNKTLAAQLYNELREILPDNAVEYFVSYYDYYQPEAYIPQSDIYIEKDASINDEIDRLRQAATSALVSRRDVIIVAASRASTAWARRRTTSGSMLALQGGRHDRARRACCGSSSTSSTAATTSPSRAASSGCAGDVVEVLPAVRGVRASGSSCSATRSSGWSTINPLTGEVLATTEELYVYPAKHFVTPARADRAGRRGHRGGAGRAARRAGAKGKLLEAQRLAHADPLRHGDDAGGRLLPGHRELLAAPRGRKAGRAALHAARLLPRGLPHDRRRVARDRAADRRRCSPATIAASGRWSSTGSGCRARSTTGR